MADRCRDLTHGSYSADAHYDTCTFLGHQLETGAVETRMGEKGIVGRVVDAYLTEVAIRRRPLQLESILLTEIAEAGPAAQLYSVDEMTTKAYSLVRLAEAEVLPSYGEIYETQSEIHWEVDGHVRHAHIDLITMAGDVVDWKTSEQRLGDRAADLSVQLSEYACAFRSVAGELPRSVVLDGLIYANPPKDVVLWRPTATKPWWDHDASTRTHEQLDAHVDRIRTRDAHRRWQATLGLYLTQGRGHPWACKDCPAKSLCPAWTGTEYEGADSVPIE